jgi:hypothetical protein
MVKVKRVDQGEPIEISEDEAVVFGRLVLVEDGVDTAPYRRYDEPIFGLLHVDSEKRVRGGAVEPDGSFYWIIPKGTYLVESVNYTKYQVFPQAAFQIPEGASAYNIGTMEIDLIFARAPDGRRYAKKKEIRVADEFEKAEKNFHYRVPGFTGGVEKRVMVLDRRLPEDGLMRSREELSEILILMEMHPQVE